MTTKGLTDYVQAEPSGFAGKLRLTEKVIVVTGATGGIGSATVLRLAEEGARGIVVSDINQQQCDAFVKNLQTKLKTKTEYLAMAIDVSDEEQVAAMFDAALEKWGHVDVAVANAGKGSAMTPLAEETTGKMDEMYRVNTLGSELQCDS